MPFLDKAGLAHLWDKINIALNGKANKTTVNELSEDVAYINEADNENVENPDIETSDIVIDSTLSETSTNPVQNKVITEKINEIDAKVVQSDWNVNDPNAAGYIKNKSLEIPYYEEIGYFSDDFNIYYDPDLYHNWVYTTITVINDQVIELPVVPGRYTVIGSLEEYGIQLTSVNTGTEYSVSYSVEKFPDGIQSIKIIKRNLVKLPDEAIPDGLIWANEIDPSNIVKITNMNFVREMSALHWDDTNDKNFILAEEVDLSATNIKKILMYSGLNDMRFGWKKILIKGYSTYEDIYSITTGQLIQDCELPYGIIILGKSFNRWFLLNPHVRLIQQLDGTWIEPGIVTDKEFILKSSTADSTKQFRITVDDTGTLTAIEVTE